MVILGIIILAGFEPVFTRAMPLGDGMALFPALYLALYSVAWCKGKNSCPLLKYVFWVYFLAAIFLLPWSMPGFVLPNTLKQWSALALLGLFMVLFEKKINNFRKQGGKSITDSE